MVTSGWVPKGWGFPAASLPKAFVLASLLAFREATGQRSSPFPPHTPPGPRGSVLRPRPQGWRTPPSPSDVCPVPGPRTQAFGLQVSVPAPPSTGQGCCMAHWEGHVAHVCVLREHLWLVPRFVTTWEGSPVLPRALGQRVGCGSNHMPRPQTQETAPGDAAGCNFRRRQQVVLEAKKCPPAAGACGRSWADSWFGDSRGHSSWDRDPIPELKNSRHSP